MDIMSSLKESLNQGLCPGHRVPRAVGWEAAEKYPTPRDCEVVIIDGDPQSDYIYMKAVDVNGGVEFERYKIVKDPIPRFEPGKYVTVDEFNNFKEEILHGFDSLKESLTAAGDRTARSGGGSKQSGRSDNGFTRPESSVQPGSGKN